MFWFIVCGPPLWSRGNIVTSHAAGAGSIPGSQFPGWDFSQGFPSTVRQMSGNLGHIRSRLSYGHHISPEPYIMRLRTATVSDYSCSTRSSLNNKHEQRFWIELSTRTQGAGVHESVVSRMSGPPPETTQDRTQRIDIKISDPAGIRTWAVGLGRRDPTDYASATDI